jgi:Ca2+-binding EF-hand superfamily protein
MFRYPIVANRGVSLEFGEEDLDLVSKMAFDFQLYHLTLNDLHENLKLRGNDGLMSYTQFHELFRELGSIRRDDAKLAAIFKSFDRTESGYCDVAELTCGLSILCQG